MTGFGRGSAATDHALATVEASSVNRKQAEVLLQAPRELAPLEARIRKAVLTRISRGRVQVAIQLDRPAGEPVPLQVDLDLAKALDAAFARISRHLGKRVHPEAGDFLRAPGLIGFDESGIDPDSAWPAVEPALEAALEQLLKMRVTEGAALAEDLAARLEILAFERAAIGEFAPRRPERQRESLHKRLKEAGLEIDLDGERLLREIALFAERCDVSEELTRLDSHFARFRELMDSDQPSGRPLDFLCQEIHREFNTIGSKASDAAIAQHVVTAKSELEKIREQVQNVE